VEGCLLALVAGEASAFPDWQWDLSGLAAMATGSGIGLRSYRRAVVAAEGALDRLLDRLAQAPRSTPFVGER
jgi:hypothetical protein